MKNFLKIFGVLLATLGLLSFWISGNDTYWFGGLGAGFVLFLGANFLLRDPAPSN